MIKNKGQFIEDMDKAKLELGYIKFNIPNPEDIYNLCGEGVWGYVSPEDKAKFNDDEYGGKITAILLNQPLNYMGDLNWGDEVVLKCNGENRPTLDPDWVMENLSDWLNEEDIER